MNTKTALWTGRTLSGLVVLFLALDGAMKLAKPAPVVETTVKLGISEGVIAPLGALLLACTALYAYRPTSILGVLLLTGYLGGAVATHVVIGGPAFSMAFPVILGALAWGGLVLRDPRLRALLPARPGHAPQVAWAE